jgi:hypothetical protein
MVHSCHHQREPTTLAHVPSKQGFYEEIWSGKKILLLPMAIKPEIKSEKEFGSHG